MDGDFHFLAGLTAQHGPLQVERASDRTLAHGGNHVAGLEPAFRRRAGLGHVGHDQLPGRSRSQRLGHDAVPGIGQPLGAHQVGRHSQSNVDGDGKTDSLSAGSNRHVDADHFAVGIQQRSAGVAGVDAGVGLNQVVVTLGVAHLHDAMQGADDAARDRVRIAVRIADRHHRFAGHQVGRRANVDHRQLATGVNLDDGQIGLGVVRLQRGHHGALVGQGDLNLAHAVDDVKVRENVSAGVDNHAGAHAVDVLRAVSAAIAFVGRLHGRLSVDGDDRGPRLLHDFDRRRDSQIRSVGASGQHAAGHQSQTHFPGQANKPAACAMVHGGKHLRMDGMCKVCEFGASGFGGRTRTDVVGRNVDRPGRRMGIRRGMVGPNKRPRFTRFAGGNRDKACAM